MEAGQSSLQSRRKYIKKVKNNQVSQINTKKTSFFSELKKQAISTDSAGLPNILVERSDLKLQSQEFIKRKSCEDYLLDTSPLREGIVLENCERKEIIKTSSFSLNIDSNKKYENQETSKNEEVQKNEEIVKKEFSTKLLISGLEETNEEYVFEQNVNLNNLTIPLKNTHLISSSLRYFPEVEENPESVVLQRANSSGSATPYTPHRYTDYAARLHNILLFAFPHSDECLEETSEPTKQN